MSSGHAADRLNLRLRVLLGDGTTSYQASTVHVSRTDMVVTCRTPLAAGKTVDAVVVLPGGAARVRAEVAWVRDAERTPLGHMRSTMGLRFVLAPGPAWDAWFTSAAERSLQRTLPPPATPRPGAGTPATAAGQAPVAGPARAPIAARPAATVRGYLPLHVAGAVK